MSKIKKCVNIFLNKHFVKWKFLQSTFVIPFQKKWEDVFAYFAGL